MVLFERKGQPRKGFILQIEMHKLMDYDVGLVMVHLVTGVCDEQVVPNARATSSECGLLRIRGQGPKYWT